MNDEEKKVIEFLKENMLDYEEIDTSILLDINSKHKTILNLIEKLQKESEELKEDRDKFKKNLLKRITYCNELEKDLFENGSNYVIPKEKVKDKIEEIDEKIKYEDNEKVIIWLHKQKKILQELLEKRK